jgi:hypothetical protein
MKTLLAISCALLLLSSTSPAQTAGRSATTSAAVGTPTAVPLPPFSAVELRHGGTVILRHGSTQRVTFLNGSPAYAELSVGPGGLLIIEKCKPTCPDGYDQEIEIVTPGLAGVSVAEGGTIEVRGAFPHVAEVNLTVTNGGTVDARSMAANSVTASVNSGGRIFTNPLTAMVATVVQGGNITYWGDGRVTSSIQHGGVVEKGPASHADKPLSELTAPGRVRPPSP